MTKKNIHICFDQTKKLFYISILLLSGVLTGCSSDSEGDEEGGGEITPPTSSHTLGTGNANMPSSGTIELLNSSSPAGSEIKKLVDDNVNTTFSANHAAFEILWRGNSAKAITSYTLTSASDAPECDPRSWTLSGSIDNTEWTVIDTQENQTFVNRKEDHVYDISNGTEFRYYKLTILDNNGGATTQLAEWRMSSIAPYYGNINDLLPKTSGSTFSAICPLGTKHEGDLEATKEQLAWLADPSKEPKEFMNGDDKKFQWNFFKSTTLYPHGTPTPADVNQHSVPDCCLCAVLGSMAYLYPRFIKSIIKDNGDQTYTVTLFDPKAQKIEVGVSNYFISNSDGTKLDAVSGRNREVTWATVLQKAVMKWFQVYKEQTDWIVKYNIRGIATADAAPIFTGNGESYSFSPNSVNALDLARAVEVCLKQGRMGVGGYNQSDLQVDENHKTVKNHAFSVILPDDDSHLFKMRNPWGGTTDGVMKVKDDGKVPPTIDIRFCAPGAAKGYGIGGDLASYIPIY